MAIRHCVNNFIILQFTTSTLFNSDVLGSTAFMPVKSDINGNIQVHELVTIQPDLLTCRPDLDTVRTINSVCGT